MTEPQQTVGAPAFKIASAWAAVAVTSWADFAAMLAAFYTLLLICEWFWKKVIRPACEIRGWVKRKKRRADDN
jgi:uncharacterized protein HemY